MVTKMRLTIYTHSTFAVSPFPDHRNDRNSKHWNIEEGLKLNLRKRII